MERTTILTVAEVAEATVKMTLPAPLRVGDRLTLRFRLRRQHQGRTEALEVLGVYRVVSSAVGAQHHAVEVESTGLAPRWRAVKKERPFRRILGPTHLKGTVGG